MRMTVSLGLDAVCFTEALVVFGKGCVLDALEAVDILVRVEQVVLQLDHSDRDVRAMVAHSLVIGQQIVEHKAVLQRADTAR